MFSFLSKGWRVPQTSTSGGNSNTEADDAASIRSFSLPWPVTEAATRKNKTPWTTSQPQQQQQPQGPVPRDISYPIPRMVPNSLTGFDAPAAYPARPRPRADVEFSDDHLPSTSNTSSSSPPSKPWFEESAARRRERERGPPRPEGRTGFYPVPDVVRVEEAPPVIIPNDNDSRHDLTTRVDVDPPIYTELIRSTNNSNNHLPAYVFPSTSPQPGGDHAQPHDPRYDETYDDFYAHYETDERNHTSSPFDSDSSEDVHSQSFPIPPSTIPSPRPGQQQSQQQQQQQLHHPPKWGGLTLHTSSPFSQSSHSLRTTEGVNNNVSTDVYNHAYNYPAAKQLSPIVEQDYISPASAKSGGRMFGSRNPSLSSVNPAQSVFRLASVSGLKGPTPEEGADKGENEGGRPRLGSRSGSMSSMRTLAGAGAALSRAGSLSIKEGGNVVPGSPNPSPGGSMGSEVIPRPSPVYSSPFITRHLNRTVSQTSSKSDSQSQGQPRTRPSTAASTNPPSHPNSRSNTAETVLTPTTNTGSVYTPASTMIQSPSSPNSTSTVQAPSPVLPTPVIPALDLRPFFPGPHPNMSSGNEESAKARPSRSRAGPPNASKRKPGVDKMPVIDGSVEGYHEEPYMDEDDDDEEEEGDDLEEGYDTDEAYELESLHAESFVTASPHDEAAGSSSAKTKVGEGGLALPVSPKRNGKEKEKDVTSLVPSAQSNQSEGFITRRWERSAALFSSPMLSPAAIRTKKHQRVWEKAQKRPLYAHMPAFWTFWAGFLFPVLWLIGGWHFTNFGEQPPKYTFWEWYFWSRHWSWALFRERLVRTFGCFGKGGNTESVEAGQKLKDQQRRQRRPGSLRPLSVSKSSLRTGKVYPALPRWIADKQSSDDGRARLNDMKRSLKGISFGYPFIPRQPRSLASNELAAATPPPSGLSRVGHAVLAVISLPNRLLDQLYGVKLTEVRGRPESGRRMIDPWIQRCRYALCYGLFLLAIGLCTASAYLIVRNTKSL